MSLTVQQLNGDTTFLLTFRPSFAPDGSSKRFPGDFTILIDPWLKGSSSILHPKFQISYHTSDTVLPSLADLKELPDIILISQDKPDHCHQETLCSLPKDSNVRILATAAAAKKIASWKHFNAAQIEVMQTYEPNKPDTISKIPIEAYSPSSFDGEVTIANIPKKRDMTGLHNAIGLTYRPPSSVLSIKTQSGDHHGNAAATLSEPAVFNLTSQRPRTASSSAQPALSNLFGTTTNSETSSGRVDSGIARSSLNGLSSNTESTLSVIYTPHGVPTQVLSPYIEKHLQPLNALPVTAIFHSINVEQNPWFMGGLVASGAPGGVHIAKATNASYWIGAHDEFKDNRGAATTWIKSRQFEVGEVESMCREAGVGTRVSWLGVGEEASFGRDV